MKIHYKRKFAVLIITFSITLYLLSSCFFSASANNRITFSEDFSGLTVSFIDVGQGDCIFISFGDGNNLMIDCGSSEEASVNAVSKLLAKLNVTSIYNLVLTHPDSDHIGGALSLLSNYNVQKVYIPQILNTKPFSLFEDVLLSLSQRSIPTIISDSSNLIKGENYSVVFLSPSPIQNSNSIYREFNLSSNPTEEQINNLSPMIYLEYKGVRFLFTGDAGEKEENKVINNYYSNYYLNLYSTKGVTVNLENIDFLKVSHHGSADSTKERFLQMLNPKYAVISVGGNNIYSHPSTTLLKRIYTYSPKAKILRTDVKGNVVVRVSENGKQEIMWGRI